MERERKSEGHGTHIAYAIEYARKVQGTRKGNVRNMSRTWTDHDRETSGKLTEH